MYVITNRALTRAKNLGAFGKTPSAKGPNEIRIVRVKRSGRGWRVDHVPDRLNSSSVRALKSKFKLDLDARSTWHGSLQVACELFEQARREKKSILFFVHGYNNDVGDVLKAAEEIERLYNVIVVPFTWPANGGGVVSGTASYLSDKADARASAGALNRVIGKIQYFHLMLTAGQKSACLQKVKTRHPSNPELASALFAQLLEKECEVKINLLCHSMGNYVFKHTFATSQNMTSKLVFDNICLVAADTNNADHRDWVSQLDVRNRLYIVINENDAALKASRIKPGDEQKARLGHYTKKLNSPNTHYVDISGAPEVGAGHSYFKGDAVEKNDCLQQMFGAMFCGKAADSLLDYQVANNAHILKCLD